MDVEVDAFALTISVFGNIGAHNACKVKLDGGAFVTVTADGNGDAYHRFTGVAPGWHTITVTNISGTDIMTVDVYMEDTSSMAAAASRSIRVKVTEDPPHGVARGSGYAIQILDGTMTVSGGTASGLKVDTSVAGGMRRTFGANLTVNLPKKYRVSVAY